MYYLKQSHKAGFLMYTIDMKKRFNWHAVAAAIAVGIVALSLASVAYSKTYIVQYLATI